MDDEYCSCIVLYLVLSDDDDDDDDEDAVILHCTENATKVK